MQLVPLRRGADRPSDGKPLELQLGVDVLERHDRARGGAPVQVGESSRIRSLKPTWL